MLLAWLGLISVATALNKKPCLPVEDCSTIPIPNSGYYQFRFGSKSTQASPQTFSINTLDELILFVVDGFCTGDQFTVVDNGLPLGITSFITDPTLSSSECPLYVANPQGATSGPMSDGMYSGAFLLLPGAHNITIKPAVSFYGGGIGYLYLFTAEPSATTTGNVPPKFWVPYDFQTWVPICLYSEDDDCNFDQVYPLVCPDRDPNQCSQKKKKKTRN